jgi:hypothetical protein
MGKAAWLIVVLVVGVPVAWSLLSPLWRDVAIDERSPLEAVEVLDALDTMDAATKQKFEQEVAAMEGKALLMKESMPVAAQLLAVGQFEPRAHEVAGRALLIQDGEQTIVRFEDFETINGPNLHIYLSADLSGSDYIDLGPIRATQGNVNYIVPAGIDPEKYNKVLVWCVPFRVLFSYAQLQ